MTRTKPLRVGSGTVEGGSRLHEYDREMLELEWLVEEAADVRALVEDQLQGAPVGIQFEELLRAGILMQLNALSYERLAFRLADSHSCRKFLGIGPSQQAPRLEVLRRELGRVAPTTWKQVEDALIEAGRDRGLNFRGQKYRRWK